VTSSNFPGFPWQPWRSRPSNPNSGDSPDRLPDGGLDPKPVGRVTRSAEPLYSEPDLRAARLARLQRDDLVELHEAFLSPNGPLHNPRWYRVDGGFLHSAHIQRIDSPRLNPPLSEPPPPSGLLGEVTVPITRVINKTRAGSWMPLYRLYYGSLHWITGRDLLLRTIEIRRRVRCAGKTI
jgi:hypothetical protein